MPAVASRAGRGNPGLPVPYVNATPYLGDAGTVDLRRVRHRGGELFFLQSTPICCGPCAQSSSSCIPRCATPTSAAPARRNGLDWQTVPRLGQCAGRLKVFRYSTVSRFCCGLSRDAHSGM